MQKTLNDMAREADGHLHAIQLVLRQPMQSEIARGGLTGPQVNILAVATRRPGLSLKELREEVGLAHSTVSGIVSRLEKRGLLEVRADGWDGRLRRVRPTRLVRDYVKNVMPGLMLHPLVTALEDMKPAARAAALGGLRLLREAVEKADRKRGGGR